MVRVEQIEGNTHPKAPIKALWEYFPLEHHYGAERRFNRSASRYNAAPVLITAYITA